MALFGGSNAFVGIDVGTSSLKIVELTGRRRRVEVTAYAQTDFPNPLAAQEADEKAVAQTADVIKQMLEKADISSDAAVVALPASTVFSTVIKLPSIPDKELDKAVEFAARDVVPADLDEVVLGYSRLGDHPHMETDNDTGQVVATSSPGSPGKPTPPPLPPAQPKPTGQTPDKPVPVFVTAAPKYLVDRYSQLLDQLKLKLVALELETFPLVRSLLTGSAPSGVIVDIGDLATTFHIIDSGTPRVSHTIEFGGHAITEALANSLKVPMDKAEAAKAKHGLLPSGSVAQRQTVEAAVNKQITKVRNLLQLYQNQEGRNVSQMVLIGGGANLPGLADFWTKASGHKTSVGNPWRGLSYPNALEQKLRYLGPTYGVAVGLALRGFTQ